MSSRRVSFAVLCLSLASPACVQPPPKPAPSPPPPAPAPVVVTVKAPTPPPPPPPPPRVSDAERLLHYYDYVVGLPPDELAREQDRTMRFYAQHRSEFALLQLVLLRCRPGAAPKEYEQAVEMLSSYLKETEERPSDLRPFGVMLNNLLTEQQRQQAELQTQAQKLRDETRRNEELQQKLDALVETERKLLERSTPERTQ